jgi:hypothetical protein
MALMRERDERLYGGLDLIDHSIGGAKAVFGNVLSNRVEVNFSLRMEIVTSHCRRARRAALLARSRANTSSPGMG